MSILAVGVSTIFSENLQFILISTLKQKLLIHLLIRNVIVPAAGILFINRFKRGSYGGKILYSLSTVVFFISLEVSDLLFQVYLYARLNMGFVVMLDCILIFVSLLADYGLQKIECRGKASDSI
jgi:hypothetical protein